MPICFFCLSSQAKVPGLILHSFPREVSRRNNWLIACGYSPEDYLPSRKICSLHFEEDCYKPTKSKKILKPDAFPTRFKKVSKYTYVSNPAKNRLQFDDITNVTTSNNTGSDQTNEMPECEPSSSQEINIAGTKKHKKRQCYVGDFTNLDLCTPEKANKQFLVAKRKIIQQKRKIKTLTQQVLRLKKKLSSLLDCPLKKQIRVIQADHDYF